jgi:hypothetical protein
MFQKINLYAGILALLLFAYAQHQGWNLFEDSANAGRGGTGSSRTFHK